MVSQNILNIIIKAEDKASQVSEKVSNTFKKIGDVGKQANDKVSQSSQLTDKQYNILSKHISEVIKSTDRIGEIGTKQFNRYSESMQKSITNFDRLDNETQEMLRYLSQMSDKGREAFIGMSSKAQDAISKFNDLENETKNWGNTFDFTKAKLKQTGVDVNSLKGKVQVFGNSFISYVSPKVNSAASNIKSKFVSALATAKSKVQSLGDKFSGLGGIISSVFGGIGLKAMSDMTIGASISRDRIFNLSYALMGAGQSMEDFKNNSDSLWNMMDSDTNKSLVSLDQISQAMSTISMGISGISDKQLKALEPVVLNIGQRAILMGKDGEEAIGLMQAAGKGLNGEFEMLRENLGISKDKLEAAGWSGSADDIDGYTQALKSCLENSGDVSDMMNTTGGKLTRLQKFWGLAGRSLGDEFLPYVDKGLDYLLKFLDANNDGELDKKGKEWMQYAYGVMAAASGFATLAPTITPVLQTLDYMYKGASKAWKWAGKLKKILSNLDVSKLKDIKQKFDGFKDKIVQVKDKVVDLKNKIGSSWSEGKLSNVKLKFIQIKDSILSAKDKLIGFLGKLKTIAVAKIGALADSFRRLADSISLATIKEKLYAIWQGIVNGLTAIWNALLAMNPIYLVVIAIVALVGALFYLYNTNETVHNAIDGLWQQLQSLGAWLQDTFIATWNNLVTTLQPVVDMLSSILGPAIQGVIALLSGDTQGAMDFFTQAWNNLLSALQPVSDFLSGVFGPAWDVIVTVLSTIWNTVSQVIGAFQAFATGQMDLPTLIITIWNLVSNAYITIFSTIIRFVINFASSLINKAIVAGKGFLNGIINYINQLPGRFYNYLVSIISYIISAGASWVSNAKAKASEMVNGVISYVSQLPSKVYTEFMNIGKRITDAGKALVDKAKKIGGDIVDGVLGAMGIHSPGIIQNKVVAEFEDMTNRVHNQIKPASEVASEFGAAMVDSFGTPSLNLDTFTNSDLLMKDLDAPKMDVGVDMTSLNNANTGVINSYQNLANNTGASLQDMIDNDRNAYNLIRNNDTSQLSAIKNTVSSNMNSMSNNVKNSMDNMLNKNRTGLTSARNTTKTQLNNITNATVKANQKMIESWQTMKTGIVSAADKIKSGSTQHFNTLEKTIGSFYNKLQNPSGFGAGPSSTGRVSRVKRTTGGVNGFKRIANVMKQYSIPNYIGLGEVKRNPFISTDNIGKYITPVKNNLYSVNDLIHSGNIRIPIGLQDPTNKGAGSWTDGVSKHIDKIKNTSKKWSMKGPKIIGKYATSTGFKVADFINGVPKINFKTFKQMAQDVFSQCHYEFYYDSNKYGNWMNAFQHGGMNCSDSTDALIAMANACGLTANKIHGHWNQFGHYWANIDGHKMDTTGWMNQRNWTPAASHAGPAPKSMSIGDVFEELKNIFQDNDASIENNESSTTDEVILSGEATIKHEFINLPENIDADEVARLVNETTNTNDWIKNLVKNNIFQKLDLQTKQRIENRNNRARGI